MPTAVTTSHEIDVNTGATQPSECQIALQSRLLKVPVGEMAAPRTHLVTVRHAPRGSDPM